MIRDGLVQTMPWEKMGFEVSGVAADGKAGLDIIRKKPPLVIFTDIMMPNLNGIELLKIVKDEFSKTKVIILSGYDQFSYAQQAVKYGAYDYLLKPVNANDLEAIMKRLKNDLEGEIDEDISEIEIQRGIAEDLQKYIRALCLGNREESLQYLNQICKNKIAQNVKKQKYEKLYMKIVNSVLYFLKRDGIQMDEKIYLKCRDMIMDLFCITDEQEISHQMEIFTDYMIAELSTQKTENYNAVIQSAIKYIDAHYNENLSVQSVSDYVYLSSNYFSHIFRKITGERFTDYLNKKRIGKAQIVLLQNKLKVYEVAEMVGYSDYKYFSSVFKKLTGTSPTEFSNTPQALKG